MSKPALEWPGSGWQGSFAKQCLIFYEHVLQVLNSMRTSEGVVVTGGGRMRAVHHPCVGVRNELEVHGIHLIDLHHLQHGQQGSNLSHKHLAGLADCFPSFL